MWRKEFWPLWRSLFWWTASVGIALFPDNGADLARLSQCADSALFRAKAQGRSNFQFFAQQPPASKLWASRRWCAGSTLSGTW